MKNLNKNLIFFVMTFLVGLAVGVGAFYYYTDSVKPSKPEEKEKIFLSAEEAGEYAIEYINDQVLKGEFDASLIDVAEENGLYRLLLKIGEQEFKSYITKDGKLLFPEAIDMTLSLETYESEEGDSQETPPQEIPKRETIDVKLFVMSYCPYGLQAQKMFLPVFDLLKDKAEMGIYFVNYIMHGKEELDENLRQYCIQKEEKEKLDEYLSCFVKDGNFEGCLSQASIDRGKLNACISETDKKYGITEKYNDKSTWLNGRFPKFDVHTDLNEEFGVRGSPTIVINGQQVAVSPRSPEQFKNTICQAFSSPPQECSRGLSQDVSSPGLGEGSGSSGGGSCE